GRRLMADADAVGDRARALKAGDTGLLRIGATPQAIESLLIDFLAGYRPRHPGVEIRLIEDGGVRLPDRLECGDGNLSIIPEGDGRVHARVLYPLPVLAVLTSGHRLSRRATLDVEELANDPLLLLGRGFASRE